MVDRVDVQAPSKRAKDDRARTRTRRRSRRLKAAASIAAGLTAGTFLTVHRRTAQRVAKGRGSRLVLRAVAPVVALVLSSCVDPSEIRELKENQNRIIRMLQRLEKKCSDSATEKPKPEESKPPGPSKKRPKVDLEQHRKGMPVPDNLLE